MLTGTFEVRRASVAASLAGYGKTRVEPFSIDEWISTQPSALSKVGPSRPLAHHRTWTKAAPRSSGDGVRREKTPEPFGSQHIFRIVAVLL
jgi:hypothetical protein